MRRTLKDRKARTANRVRRIFYDDDEMYADLSAAAVDKDGK